MRWLFLLLFWSVLNPSFAQQIEVGSSKNMISRNEEVKYVIRITNTDRGDINQPAFQDFQLLAEPLRSQETRIINGVVSSFVDIIYYIKPKRSGRLVVEPAELVVDGQTFTSDSLVIQVSESTETLSGPMLCRYYLNKDEAYVGEQLEATYTVLSRYRSVRPIDNEFPTNRGFHSVPLYTLDQDWLPDLVRQNGVNYLEAVLKKEVLFPQNAGTYNLGSFDFSANVGGDGFYASGENITATSNSKKITIKPLPEGQPKSFGGAVGKFQYNLSFDKTTLKVNEPITVKVEVSGVGNVKFIDVPMPEFPKGNFEVFDAYIENSDTITAAGIGGTRSANYLVIPRVAGEYDLGTMDFSYFDPVAEQYVEVPGIPLQFSVLNTDGSSNGPAVIVTNTPEQNAISEKEDRPLRTVNLKPFLEAKPFFTFPYVMGVLSPFLLFLAVVFGRRWYKKTRKDEITLRTIKASKVSLEHLKEAKNALAADSDNNFYDKIHRAIFGYLADKLRLNTTEMDQAQIKQTLASKGVPESTVNNVDALIERCLMARFAPLADLSREEVLRDTEKAIDELEKAL